MVTDVLRHLHTEAEFRAGKVAILNALEACLIKEFQMAAAVPGGDATYTVAQAHIKTARLSNE